MTMAASHIVLFSEPCSLFAETAVEQGCSCPRTGQSGLTESVYIAYGICIYRLC